MNERELLVDCLRCLNRTGRQWAQELNLAGDLERLLSGEIRPKQT